MDTAIGNECRKTRFALSADQHFRPCVPLLSPHPFKPFFWRAPTGATSQVTVNSSKKRIQPHF